MRIRDPSWLGIGWGNCRFRRTLLEDDSRCVTRRPTFLIAAGIPLKHVSDVLGHSTIAITADIYGHLLDESNWAAGEAIGRTLFGAR